MICSETLLAILITRRIEEQLFKDLIGHIEYEIIDFDLTIYNYIAVIVREIFV